MASEEACDDLNILYVFVRGSQSDHPSASRAFGGVAHDVVAWIDALIDSGKSMTTTRTIQLTESLGSALRGVTAGPIRAVRPSHRREPSPRIFDEIMQIAQQDRPASARMRDISSFLLKASRQGHVAEPVIEAPSALAWKLVREGVETRDQLAESTHAFTCDRKSARSSLVDALGSMTDRVQAWGVHIVVFANSAQKQYLEALLRNSLSACMPESPRMCLREFVNRENLSSGTCVTPSILRSANLDDIASAASKLSATRLTFELAKICQMNMQRVIDHGVRARCMALLKNTQYRSSDAEPASVQGGMVIEPDATIVWRPVCVMDFASLYPSLIVSRRIGGGMGLPEIVERLMELRRNSSNPALARACKLMANSFYGQLASRTSSIYDPGIAGEITGAGRESLSKLTGAVSKHGGEVLYGDTDSAMAIFGQADAENAKSTCQAFLDAFNLTLPQPMRVCLQSVFRPCIFLSKKRYIARDESGALVSVGTPNIRSDWPPLLRRLYTKVACALMDPEGGGDSSLCALLAECVDAIATCERTEEFVACRKIADPGSASRHAELARTETFREDGLGYASGDSIEYIVYELDDGANSSGRHRERWCTPSRLPPNAKISTGAYRTMFLTQVKILIEAARGGGVAERCIAHVIPARRERAEGRTLFVDDF